MRPRSSASRSWLAVALLAGLASTALAQPASTLSEPPSARSNVLSAAITEASRRFGIPEPWIRAVIRVESFGDARAVSSRGAIGLMQVMPATYAALRAQLGLGPDPFDVRDNVLAGTAYLRLMFDRYGVQGMIGAYNAGPARWEAHLAGVRPLPAETVAYLARLAPMFGFDGAGVQASVPAARAPSPLEAPLFVALQRTSAAEPSAARRQHILALVDRNPTLVPPSTVAAERLRNPSEGRPGAKPNAPTTPAEVVGAAADGASTSLSDTLFVPPTSRRAQ